MKKYIYISVIAAASLMHVSCDDFLDTVPHDALSPETTWKTESDADKFLTGCYSKWIDDGTVLYADCGSDIGYSHHLHEGWKYIGNGGMSAGVSEVANFYDFNAIRNFNDFLANIENVEFTSQAKKDDMIGQVKTMRAWQYFEKNWYYGGVPIIESYETAEEAQVPRNTEAEVKEFIYKELDEAIPMLNIDAVEAGRINRGVALSIKMRSALYYGDYARAKQAAVEIAKLGLYDLEPSSVDNPASGYKKLFLIEGQQSKEIIFSVVHDQVIMSNWMVATMYNNADGGWSSMVPTKNLVDMYEMTNGLTKDEAGSGYDPAHPFYNRDPRMAATILYPGRNWLTIDGEVVVINTLDEEIDGKSNPNDPSGVDNASKTGLTWAKYLGTGPTYYADMWNANANTIMFRYAETLLSFAEAKNELDGPCDSVYVALNKIRFRAGMPSVDKGKYSTKETLRELIRRERTVELAGEGFRRADILRWKDNNGKVLAETVLNGELKRYVGTVNYDETVPEKRAVISEDTELVEKRVFVSHNRYLPILQEYIDLNSKLVQNPGY